MSDNRLGDRICFHLFECLAINCRPALFPNNWDTKSIIEQRMQVGVRSPIEMWESNAFENNPLKVLFESFDFLMEGIYDLGFLNIVNSYSPQAHLKRRALKGFGEIVGGCGVIIKLW